MTITFSPDCKGSVNSNDPVVSTTAGELFTATFAPGAVDPVTVIVAVSTIAPSVGNEIERVGLDALNNTV